MGFQMQRSWSKKNVDLKLLAEEIGEFFKDNDFEVVVNETKSGYQLLAKGSPNYEINGQISVAVDGKPEEFSIKLELERKQTKLHGILLPTLFGGGYLLRQQFNADEAWIEFRRDFWQHVDRIVTYLIGSASIFA